MSLTNMLLSLMCFVAYAAAATPTPTPTGPVTDAAYQFGIWSGFFLLVALLMAIQVVGSIDYSNDILIITNAGDKKE